MNADDNQFLTFVNGVLESMHTATDNLGRKSIVSFAAGHLVRFPMLGESAATVVGRGIRKCLDDRRFFSLAAIAALAGREEPLRALLKGRWSGNFNYLMETGRQLAFGSADDLEDLLSKVTVSGWSDLDVREVQETQPMLLQPRLALAEAAEIHVRDNPAWVAEAEDAFDSILLGEDGNEPDEPSEPEGVEQAVPFSLHANDGDIAAGARATDVAKTEPVLQRRAAEERSLAHPLTDNAEAPRGLVDHPIESLDSRQAEELARGLGLVSLGMLLEQPIKARRLVFGNVLERGVVTLFAAAPGVGKTTATTRIAAAIAKGEAWAGFDVPGPGVVVYVNAEETRDEVKRRFQAAVQDAELDAEAIDRIKMINQQGALRLMHKVDGKPKITPVGRALRELIIDMQPAAVVLDPLALIHDLDENLNAEMTALLELLHQVARTAECAILLVHHARKDARAATMDVARGAGALAASARAMFVLSEVDCDSTQDEGAPVATVELTCVKSNNHARANRVTPFHRGSIRLASGDEVGTLVPAAEGTQRTDRRRGR